MRLLGLLTVSLLAVLGWTGVASAQGYGSHYGSYRSSYYSYPSYYYPSYYSYPSYSYSYPSYGYTSPSPSCPAPGKTDTSSDVVLRELLIRRLLTEQPPASVQQAAVVPVSPLTARPAEPVSNQGGFTPEEVATLKSLLKQVAADRAKMANDK